MEGEEASLTAGLVVHGQEPQHLSIVRYDEVWRDWPETKDGIRNAERMLEILHHARRPNRNPFRRRRHHRQPAQFRPCTLRSSTGRSRAPHVHHAMVIDESLPSPAGEHADRRKRSADGELHVIQNCRCHDLAGTWRRDQPLEKEDLGTGCCCEYGGSSPRRDTPGPLHILLVARIGAEALRLAIIH